MTKFTLKQIKELVKAGIATDITSYGFEKMNGFLKSHQIERIGYSRGIYGLTGKVLVDENKQLYAITAPNSAIFQTP